MEDFENLDIDSENKLVFLDIDGTIIPDGAAPEFSDAVLGKIRQLKAGNQVFLCTNTRDKIRNNKIASLLGLPVAAEQYRKPDHRVLKGLGLDHSKNRLVIGDKFLTDGLFAWNIGAEFIKVKRKVSGKEVPTIKLIDFIDDLIWQILKFLKII